MEVKRCLTCNEEFNAYQSKLKYCSQVCFHKRRELVEPSVCLVCGKEFKHRNAGANKYCSNYCNGIGTRTIQEKQCKVCGITFRPSEDSRECCSLKCANLSKRKYPTKTCPVCNNEFITYINSEFCSRFCKKKATQKQRERKCLNCGKVFERSRSNLDQKFCCKRCHLIASNSVETDIEHELYSLLDISGVSYQKQYYLGFTIPDAYIPSLNLCVYADGSYWHSEKINKGKDRRQMLKLSELGYNTVRLIEVGKHLDTTPLKEILAKVNCG